MCCILFLFNFDVVIFHFVSFSRAGDVHVAILRSPVNCLLIFNNNFAVERDVYRSSWDSMSNSWKFAIEENWHVLLILTIDLDCYPMCVCAQLRTSHKQFRRQETILRSPARNIKINEFSVLVIVYLHTVELVARLKQIFGIFFCSRCEYFFSVHIFSLIYLINSPDWKPKTRKIEICVIFTLTFGDLRKFSFFFSLVNLSIIEVFFTHSFVLITRHKFSRNILKNNYFKTIQMFELEFK